MEYYFGENRMHDVPIKIDGQEIVQNIWCVEFIIESNGQVNENICNRNKAGQMK